MLLQMVYRILQTLKKCIKSILTMKKICLFASIFLFYYRSKSLPSLISSFEFLRYLNSDECNISNIDIFLNKFILFRLGNADYYTSYAITNQENFSDLLLKKKIHFNYVIDEIQSLVMNPFNQYFLLSCVTGVLLADSLKDSFYRFNCKSKGPSKNLSNEEYLNNFIAKPEIKKKLTFFIDQIRNQNKYKCKGLKITRGLLLYGPPGTGKTLIARCLATINNLNFICRCASEFVEIYVGSGAKAIRDTFKEAKERKPAIIFIDELESIGFQRSSNSHEYGNNLERYTALNQLLSEMDGLNDNDDIIVVGATNRYDLLDDALIRQGRFSLKIAVDLPALDERKKIFKHYLKFFNSDIFDDDAVENFAYISKGFSGADIEGVVNEAVSKGLSENREHIDKEDIINLINYNINQKFDYDYLSSRSVNNTNNIK